MKNLIKLSLTVAFMALIINANAQFDKSKLKLGIKAGLNLADIAQDFKNSEEESDTKMSLGLAIGLVAEYEIQENLAFQSGLMLTRKGYKIDESADGEKYEEKVKVTYLEIPLHLAYKMDAFQFYAGPYIAFGLSGKWEEEYSYDEETEKYDGDIVFGNDRKDAKEGEMMIRGFDAGLDFGVGYQTGPILINAGYSLGLSNLMADPNEDDDKVFNRVFKLSVSYFFGK